MTAVGPRSWCPPAPEASASQESRCIRVLILDGGPPESRVCAPGQGRGTKENKLVFETEITVKSGPSSGTSSSVPNVPLLGGEIMGGSTFQTPNHPSLVLL